MSDPIVAEPDLGDSGTKDSGIKDSGTKDSGTKKSGRIQPPVNKKRVGKPAAKKPTSGTWLYWVAVVSLLAAVYLLITPGGSNNVQTIQANAFSRSALGHYGLIKLLQELDEPVVRQRSRIPRSAGLLVLAEPDNPKDIVEQDRIADAMDAARDTLLILPKRHGIEDTAQARWISESKLVDLEDIYDTLEWLPMRNMPAISRVDEVRTWQVFEGKPAPVIPGPVQLLAHDDLITPMIECRDGVLLGYLNGRHGAWVLSDPDVFANHGLLRGDNAELAVAILRRLSGGDSIAFDETLHGFAREPSAFHLAREFPAAILVVHLLLILALIALAARGRFGAIVPPPVPIGSGKAYLIENVVALQRRAGHHENSLLRYARMSVRKAAVRLRAPRGLDHEQSLDWLQQRIPDDATREELEQLCRRKHVALAPRDVAAVARRIQELTNRIGNAS